MSGLFQSNKKIALEENPEDRKSKVKRCTILAPQAPGPAPDPGQAEHSCLQSRTPTWP